MAWTKDQKIAAFLSLGLIPLFMGVSAGAKETCYKGQVMWEAYRASAYSFVSYDVRVVCQPTDGPFVAQFSPRKAGELPDWRTMEERFMHVADAREALEERFHDGT